MTEPQMAQLGLRRSVRRILKDATLVQTIVCNCDKPGCAGDMHVFRLPDGTHAAVRQRGYEIKYGAHLARVTMPE